MKKAKLWEQEKGKDFIKCTTCRQYCRILEGKTGICGVRQNIKGELFSLVYGKAAAAHIDPIEKKPLFHFLPGSSIFSIGTLGCNFGCAFCQNWDISQATKELRKKSESMELLEKLELKISKYGYDLPPKEIIAFCEEKGISSIAYTYNEPSVFFDYTYDTAKPANKKGLKNVYVSNGYASEEAVDEIAPYLDAINIDLKSFNNDFYRRVCQARLEPVLESIKYYHKKKIWIEITTLIIPGQNDSHKELKQIADFIFSVSPDIPWHLSRFTPSYKMTDGDSTDIKILKKAYEIGKKAGIKFVYAGNIDSVDMQSTYCPKCNVVLIERNWHYSTITENFDLEGGKCNKCQEFIPGVWR